MFNLILGMLILLPALTYAGQEDYVLTIKDHKFSPEELSIPAGKKIEVVIYNQDNKRETFYSFDLNRETAIDANGNRKIYIGPLKSGKYKFEGKRHSTTAKGVIIAQ